MLRTARLSSFKLIMTETYGGRTMAIARRHVADEMTNAGLVRQMAIGVYGSELLFTHHQKCKLCLCAHGSKPSAWQTLDST